MLGAFSKAPRMSEQLLYGIQAFALSLQDTFDHEMREPDELKLEAGKQGGEQQAFSICFDKGAAS